MLKHLLNILWVRKRKNSLMVIEIGFSFVILFLLFSLLVEKLENYSRDTGFSTENIMILNLDNQNIFEEFKDKAFVDNLYTSLFQAIRSNNEVIDVTEMDYAHPYGNSRNTTRLEFKNGIKFYPTEQRFRPSAVNFLDLNFVKGRAFLTEDAHGSKEPIIVNQLFYERLVPYINQDDSFISEEQEYQIVGVIDNYNFSNDFDDQLDIVIKNASFLSWMKDDHQDKIFIKTKNDPRKIEVQLVNQLEKINPKLKINAGYFDSAQSDKNNNEILPLFLISFVSLFLVINIALGLYGVLWFNITKRKSEIGIRRAMGASTQDIFKQIFSEVALLFIIGILLGSVIAIQFPLLGTFNFSNTEYLMGALLSLGFVLLITIACGYYPSKLATKITPLEALHEL
ncbi:ABC transporter permease [Flammeovirga kamogawensis]|uniref:FtsX-like permease family protein n=1 Tax=Flammeovirga kamogawensis TaxID=373891 RepID=A0ABX8H3Z8_9BACT|nr:FtsX-like permease family protein [Flammeovirga kamogawensis]MBB6460486.1 putative ABC transport system permease protein [Flammeovirga kamogawensis]QWG10292.1 FtsX-like permease family protein [Flammeovirga kamogawensis]TRX64740.1 FtsX-like permease family protein [Flammeovirga kamogawensis]